METRRLFTSGGKVSHKTYLRNQKQKCVINECESRTYGRERIFSQLMPVCSRCRKFLRAVRLDQFSKHEGTLQRTLSSLVDFHSDEDLALSFPHNLPLPVVQRTKAHLSVYKCDQCGTELLSEKPKEETLWYNRVTKLLFCSSCYDVVTCITRYRPIFNEAGSIVGQKVIKPIHPRLEPMFQFKED